VEAIPREVLICQNDDGSEPFTKWLNGLDPKTRGIVRNRIDRIESGLFGDTRSIGEGVTELRIDHGPGYRVYFGQVGKEVHLINGGSKQTQSQNIADAKDFWKTHE
jgi:putative addiction module killer protein